MIMREEIRHDIENLKNNILRIEDTDRLFAVKL